jgi:hypothetical protein
LLLLLLLGMRLGFCSWKRWCIERPAFGLSRLLAAATGTACWCIFKVAIGAVPGVGACPLACQFCCLKPVLLLLLSLLLKRRHRLLLLAC